MSTNYAKAHYTEIIDLQTVPGKTSLVGIHTPTGLNPYRKLRGYFNQFRKYRYKGISKLTMVPAANLPVDPLGLTGIQGTTDLMDPRDALNPIMFHGCHGEAMSNVIDKLFKNNATSYSQSGADMAMNPTLGYISASADCEEFDQGSSQLSALESQYYRALTDPTWKKYGIQSPVHIRNLHPLTWNVVRSMPLVPNAADGGVNGLIGAVTSGTTTADLFAKNNSATTGVTIDTVFGNAPNISEGSLFRSFVQEFTNGVSRLGWLPTVSDGVSQGSNPGLTILPKLFMGVLLLPPSYNVQQFFRLAITHVFEFKDFTASLAPLTELVATSSGDNLSYFNWIKYTEDGSKVVTESSELNENGTFDTLNGSTSLISEGVN